MTFAYRDDHLFCEEVSLETIAGDVGTPVYVYSGGQISSQLDAFRAGLGDLRHLICFAVKACSNLAILKLLFERGAGADIVSGGELYRALRAGADPQKIVFSGVGKTRAEMAAALEANILAFNVESEAELEVLSAVAEELGKRAPVSLRINPDVDAETHPYISTGLKKNKFGIPAKEARRVFARAMALPGITVVGIACHIGSQLKKTAPFADATRLVAEVARDLAAAGTPLRTIDVGGGLGISYGEDGEAEPVDPREYGAALSAALGDLAADVTLICEPGRAIVGAAGALVTRVLYRKQNEDKRFVIVDAAFNDLLRPALYGAHHPMTPVHRRPDAATEICDVVGPVCETGDFLAQDRALPAVGAGDLLAVGAAGAYGFSMASNYNSRPRAAEVLVRGDSYAVIRRRETYEDLIALESIP